MIYKGNFTQISSYTKYDLHYLRVLKTSCNIQRECFQRRTASKNVPKLKHGCGRRLFLSHNCAKKVTEPCVMTRTFIQRVYYITSTLLEIITEMKMQTKPITLTCINTSFRRSLYAGTQTFSCIYPTRLVMWRHILRLPFRPQFDHGEDLSPREPLKIERCWAK